MERLKGLGNAQVPLCAATAFVMLRGELEFARKIAYRKNEYGAEAAAEAARAAVTKNAGAASSPPRDVEKNSNS